jgi:hypothetical protein
MATKKSTNKKAEAKKTVAEEPSKKPAAKKAAAPAPKSEESYEAALEKLSTLKEAASAARSLLQSFTKKNNLSMKDAPADKKLKPEWTKLTTAYSEAKANRDAQEEIAKSLKPKKEKATRYVYPKECVTGPDRKKFRAAARAEKNRAEKAANPKKKKSSTKKAETAPAKTSTKAKSGKAKSGKKKKKVSKED